MSVLIAFVAGEPAECGFAMGSDRAPVCAAQREAYAHPVPDRVFLALVFVALPAIAAARIGQRRWWAVTAASVVIAALVPLSVFLEGLGS